MALLIAAALSASGRRPLTGDECTTERLILAEIDPSQFDAIHAYSSDPDVSRFMAWGPNKPADTHAFIARALAERATTPRTDWNFAVFTRSDADMRVPPELIGSCRISIRNEANQQGDIGYVFARSAWGKGYATEVARRLIQFGFSRLDLHRIFATCHIDNLASAHVLEKCGMHLEGRLRHHGSIRGEWCDSFLYAIVNK